jgi:hypothetical protein
MDLTEDPWLRILDGEHNMGFVGLNGGFFKATTPCIAEARGENPGTF